MDAFRLTVWLQSLAFRCGFESGSFHDTLIKLARQVIGDCRADVAASSWVVSQRQTNRNQYTGGITLYDISSIHQGTMSAADSLAVSCYTAMQLAGADVRATARKLPSCEGKEIQRQDPNAPRAKLRWETVRRGQEVHRSYAIELQSLSQRTACRGSRIAASASCRAL